MVFVILFIRYLQNLTKLFLNKFHIWERVLDKLIRSYSLMIKKILKPSGFEKKNVFNQQTLKFLPTRQFPLIIEKVPQTKKFGM